MVDIKVNIEVERPPFGEYMGKIIGCVYKDFAKGCGDRYYNIVTVEKFDDRGFDYLLTQDDDVIGLTEKQFFTLFMEMKREIDNINKESPQSIPEQPPPTRQVKCNKLIPDKPKYSDKVRIFI